MSSTDISDLLVVCYGSREEKIFLQLDIREL
jgi:hypothetical protein